eukprot:3657752-Amphidinium_carterae.1
MSLDQKDIKDGKTMGTQNSTNKGSSSEYRRSALVHCIGGHLLSKGPLVPESYAKSRVHGRNLLNKESISIQRIDTQIWKTRLFGPSSLSLNRAGAIWAAPCTKTAPPSGLSSMK